MTAPTIRAELTGSRTATANGIVGTGPDPILKLARLLIAVGANPKSPLECYRGEILRRGRGRAQKSLDLYIFGKDALPLIAECKARKNGAGFATLETWLGENDALFLRRNHAFPIVVLPWKTWLALFEQVRR